MNPIEKNAGDILVFAVEQNDNYVTGSKVAASLGIQMDDIADALDVLTSRSAIDRHTRHDGRVTRKGKLMYHRMKGTMQTVKENGQRIVEFLIKTNRDRTDAMTIMKNTGLKENEVKDAVNFLEIQNAISVVRTVNKQPADFAQLLLTGEGKNWYHSQKQENVRSKVQEERSAAKWDIFICHASEDKNAVARPLAKALQDRHMKVWYDEFELSLGDSLRRKIDNGLANSRFGVVILSKGFFGKEWPQKELDGLAAREDGKEKVILPVWHDVDKEYVVRYSPTLADKKAVSTEEGLDKVVNEILNVVVGKHTDQISEPSLPQSRRIGSRRIKARKGRGIDSWRGKVGLSAIGIVLLIIIYAIAGIVSDTRGIVVYDNFPSGPFYPMYNPYTITVKNNAPTPPTNIVPLYFVQFEFTNVICKWAATGDIMESGHTWDVGRIDPGQSYDFLISLETKNLDFTIDVEVFLNLWNMRISASARSIRFLQQQNGTFVKEPTSSMQVSMPIPGFPLESIVLGLALGTAFVILANRKRWLN